MMNRSLTPACLQDAIERWQVLGAHPAAQSETWFPDIFCQIKAAESPS